MRYYPPRSAKVGKPIVVHLSMDRGEAVAAARGAMLSMEPVEVATACGRTSDVAFVSDDEAEATCTQCHASRRKAARKAGP
jgi:Zn finger protein HypA/HybF involved in hydrogenase expression